MSMDEEITEGWTEDLTAQLLIDAVAVPGGITGATLAFKLWDKDGAAITLGGTASIVDGAAATVKYVPGSGDFLASKSPYSARWQITSAGKVSHFPQGRAARIVVRKP